VKYDVGDKVKIGRNNDYDWDSPPSDKWFEGSVGEIVRIGYDVPIPEATLELYHVRVESENPLVRSDNPWPFYAYELDGRA
jgi:hypothetical protein